MNTTRLFVAVLLTSFGSGHLSAQTTYPGTKSNFTLSITATGELGGYKIKDSALPANTAKGITFEEPLDPLGHEIDESDPLHYYATKITTKTGTFTSGDEEVILDTDVLVDRVVKLYSRKFTNVNFIQELIDRGLVEGIDNPRGYKLVAIRPEVRPDGSYVPRGGGLPLLFFIENGSSVHYVGRQGTEPVIAADALILNFAEGVEVTNYKLRSRYNHTTETQDIDGVPTEVLIEDTDPDQTLSHTFSSRSLTDFFVFGSRTVEDEENPENVEDGTGLGFHIIGETKYSGKYDPRGGRYITTKASLSGGVGSFDDVDNESSPQGIANGSFSLSSTKTVDDITPYLDAIPSDLGWLRDLITESYPGGDEEEEEEEEQGGGEGEGEGETPVSE